MHGHLCGLLILLVASTASAQEPPGVNPGSRAGRTELVPGGAVGQATTYVSPGRLGPVPNLFLGPNSVNRLSGAFNVQLNGATQFAIGAGGKPKFSGSSATPGADCGTGATTAGNDVVGRVTIGTASLTNTCTITFLSAWSGSAPVCNVQDETNGRALFPQPSLTVLAILTTNALAFAASDTVSWSCVQYN